MPRELNIIEKKVKSLTFADIQTIIGDYELFEEQGFIDDCRLRRAAQELLKQHNISDCSPVMWMNLLAFECYRVFARYYIDSCTAKKEG